MQRCVSMKGVRMTLQEAKLCGDLTIRACDDLACSMNGVSKKPNKREMFLTNAMTMVKSSAFNEALLVRRATKRSITAIQARDKHIAYDAMMLGTRS